jgi:hypothetical protein
MVTHTSTDVIDTRSPTRQRGPGPVLVVLALALAACSSATGSARGEGPTTPAGAAGTSPATDPDATAAGTSRATTSPEPTDPLADIVVDDGPARTLEPGEMVFAGRWAGVVTNDHGLGELMLDLRHDGTFATMPTEELCGLTGTWHLVDEPGTLRAEGTCDDEAIVLTASPNPARLAGVWANQDGESGSFQLQYEPATVRRPLTMSEEALVGTWEGEINGKLGTSDLEVELGADGTFSGAGWASYCPANGHWEVTPEGTMTVAGNDTCDGTAIRMWGPADPDLFEAEWMSGAGFEGTARIEPAAGV